MERAPEISVIIPVYNVAAFLDRCLDSILRQTFPDFEIILVDDCSTDGSLKVAESHAEQDGRITIIAKRHNEGTMLARRSGYENARGRYIVFCDSDDYLPSDALERLHAAITESGRDIIISDCTVVDNGREYYSRRTPDEIDSTAAAYRALVGSRMRAFLWGAIYDRNLFLSKLETIAGQCVNEDYILWLQLLRNARSIGQLHESTYFYYYHPQSITKKRPTTQKLLQDLRANQWCYDFLTANGIVPDLAHVHYIRRIVNNLRDGFTLEQIAGTGYLDRNVFNADNIIRYCRMRYLLKYHYLRMLRACTPVSRRLQ